MLADWFAYVNWFSHFNRPQNDQSVIGRQLPPLTLHVEYGHEFAGFRFRLALVKLTPLPYNIGVMGLILHVQADFTSQSVIVPERFLRGAPPLAPLLFANMGLVGLLILLPPDTSRLIYISSN